MDIRIHDCGSIVQLEPLTPEGEAFIRDELDTEGWQWLGKRLCIDTRYTGAVIAIADERGLTTGLEVGWPV